MSISRRQFTKRALLFGAAQIAALPAFAAAGETLKHTVQRGDTLGGIALRYGVSTQSIQQANSLRGDLIKIGQELRIPAGGNAPAVANGAGHTHIVVAGDTLGAIALRYGVKVDALKRSNSLRSDVIRIGQKLHIPASTGPIEDRLAAVRRTTASIDVRSQHWKRIVVHHSGIKYGNAAKYDAAHRRRGMQNGLAYHFLIGNGIDSGDGEIEIGPRWEKQLLGGHVKSYRINLTAIGICLVGNFEQSHPSARQLDAFTQLMDWLRGEVLPNARHFAGHRELKGEQTICPGRNFPLAAMHARYGD